MPFSNSPSRKRSSSSSKPTTGSSEPATPTRSAPAETRSSPCYAWICFPRLIGQDARQVEALWNKLFWATHGTAVGAITSLALAAVDTALWDVRCKAAGQPLWLLAGGYRERVPLYDTEGGWLNIAIDEIVAEAKNSVAKGWPGVKIKVGKPNPMEDVARLTAVREAIGPNIDLMIDANQSFTFAEAKKRARLFEPLNLFWFEEPMPAEDMTGHIELSRSTSTPVAVGESIYSLSHFREYLALGCLRDRAGRCRTHRRHHAVAEDRPPGRSRST